MAARDWTVEFRHEYQIDWIGRRCGDLRLVLGQDGWDGAGQ